MNSTIHANQRLRDARAHFETSSAILQSALAQEDRRKSAVEEATVAEQDAGVDDVLARAVNRRDAETILGASTRAVAAARRAQAAAKAELDAAAYGARQAAYSVISIEAADLAREIERDAAALKAKRAKLNSVRDLPGFAPPVEVAIASGDWLNVPLDRMETPSGLSTPVHKMGLVDQCADGLHHWQARVSELLRKDGEASSFEARSVA